MNQGSAGNVIAALASFFVAGLGQLVQCIRADGLRKKIERLRKLVDFPVLRKAPVANRMHGGCIVFAECLQGRGCGGVFAGVF